MALSRKQAEKKVKEAKKKGYSAKLTDSYLVIIAGKKRYEEEVKAK